MRPSLKVSIGQAGCDGERSCCTSVMEMKLTRVSTVSSSASSAALREASSGASPTAFTPSRSASPNCCASAAALASASWAFCLSGPSSLSTRVESVWYASRYCFSSSAARPAFSRASFACGCKGFSKISSLSARRAVR